MGTRHDEQAERAAADVRAIRGALVGVARESQRLSWAKERPWSPETHVWVEGVLPVVDLHDLSVKLGLAAVERVVGVELRGGAAGFITGVGRNSLHGAKMTPAVGGWLARACAERAEQGWLLRADGPGRLVVVTDPARAPQSVQTSLPQGFGWLLAALALAALAALAWQLSQIFS